MESVLARSTQVVRRHPTRPHAGRSVVKLAMTTVAFPRGSALEIPIELVLELMGMNRPARPSARRSTPLQKSVDSQPFTIPVRDDAPRPSGSPPLDAPCVPRGPVDGQDGEAPSGVGREDDEIARFDSLSIVAKAEGGSTRHGGLGHALQGEFGDAPGRVVVEGLDFEAS